MDRRLLRVDDSTVTLAVCLALVVVRDLLVMSVIIYDINHDGGSSDEDHRTA
jgi:hypothetical protein